MSSVYSQVAHSVNKNEFTMMHITTLNSFLIRSNTKFKKNGTFNHKCWYSKKFSAIKMRQAESQYFKIYTCTGHLDCKVFCLLFILYQNEHILHKGSSFISWLLLVNTCSN